MKMKRTLIAAGAILGFGVSVACANVIGNWSSIKSPPPPELKPVKVDPKTTALLMLDFMNRNCGKRPSCVATVPGAKKLLDAARAAKATVIYSFIANTGPNDVIKDVAPQQDELHVTAGPDKFFRTDLEKILKDKGIKTVITIGTASHGAVLYTASGAALRGIDAVVPVDGMSSDSDFTDMATVWTLADAPSVSRKVTLTTMGQVTF
jgi:nicotinamidase-related amidase